MTAGISFAIPSDRIRQFLADYHERQLKGKGCWEGFGPFLRVFQDAAQSGSGGQTEHGLSAAVFALNQSEKRPKGWRLGAGLGEM